LEYVIALDLGTTGNKATLVDREGRIKAAAFSSYDTFYPRPGWAEQDPDQWWMAVISAVRALLTKAQVPSHEIVALAFSGQMMGCVPVDEELKPLRRAIIWADHRAQKEAEDFKHKIGFERCYRITGHRPSAAYSGAKICWLKENEPEVYQATFKFLHAKDYIATRLTGKVATDASDAVGMNLFDITKRAWSQELIEAYEIDPVKLPEVIPSTAVVGGILMEAAAATGLLPGTPVVIGGGDGVCAAVGAGVVDEQYAYTYLGSSSWIGLASADPLLDPHLRTVTWIHLVPGRYSPNGTMQSGGAAYQWLRNNVFNDLTCLPGKTLYQYMDDLAGEVEAAAEGLFFLPYLMGERAPWWNPEARAAFAGLNIKHDKRHMIRAVLEGVAFNLGLILDIFSEQGVRVQSMRVIGGGARSSLWCQIFADVYGVPIEQGELVEEATSVGAAVAALVGSGLWSDFSRARDIFTVRQTFYPEEKRVHMYRERRQEFAGLYRALFAREFSASNF
jgi:xylulokinase